MAETLLAFDFGEKRIGVAVGNSFLRQAQALKTLHAETVDARFEQISAMIREWVPQRLVVGIPFASNGEAHALTRRCERFANQLHGRFGLPVVRVDERFTSTEAEEQHREARRAGTARAGADIDHLAAQVILQHYFDALDSNGSMTNAVA